MAALTEPRNTLRRDGAIHDYPVAADAVIQAGALLVLNGGYAEPGSAATGLVAIGRAEQSQDNTGGSDGDLTVTVRPGIYRWANSASADEIAQADVGADCYIVDDQTVAKTDGTSTRSRAGIVLAVDDDGVWVQTGPGL